MADAPTVPSQPNQPESSKARNWLIFGSVGLVAAIIFGLLYLFVIAPSIPEGNIGWFLFSFATGLTMIVMPCTLPLAFVIVPLAMGKGMVRGLGMALAFGLGVAATLSLYGIAAALLGGVAIDALGADLEAVKNWVYFVAGTFALIFALSEIGLMNIHMPSYSGAAPAFIQKRGALIKAFLLGLFLGNVGVGCPHPATPLILIEIASSGDVLYGWLLFLVHAVGRILPLLLLAFMAILGVNGLSWIMARKDGVQRATGWAMVFVAGFILTLGLFSHDWWVNSGIHSWLEVVTQESRLTTIVNETLGTDVAHVHGLEEGSGLFGLPLEWGSWFLVMVWLVPIWWWYRKRKEEVGEGKSPCDERLLKTKRNFLFVISIFLIITFVYFLPKNFYLAAISGIGHGDDHGMIESPNMIHAMPDGTIMDASGNVVPGAHVMPDGTIMMADGTTVSGGGGMMQMMRPQGETFTTDTRGLPEATGPEFVHLSDGDSYDITARYVQKEVGNRTLRMLSYNDSIPGPFITVDEGAEITINFTNLTDIEQTIHSHGVRIDNRFDGVPYSTQDPVQPGETFTYTVRFDDPGAFWYHPHTREDYGQELGLYGNYFVDPSDPEYWSPVNREVPLVLDDILINNNKIEDFYKDFSNFALLGRFGNEYMVNGVQDYTTPVEAGEVIRFFITNVSNVRTYQLSIPGAHLKLVGADLGRYERETYQESVLISPAERLVVEAYFPTEGVYKLMHTTPTGETELARFIADGEVEKSFEDEFGILRVHEDVLAEFAPLRGYHNAKPDKEILLTIDLAGMMVDHSMHTGHAHGATDSSAPVDRLSTLQWNDAMQTDVVNVTPDILWKIQDVQTGEVNMDIDWKFKVGELKKVRITNDGSADHVMQHPIHFHGQRFVVLSENGVRNENLAWKDTVLVFPGETVDILVEMSNPGEWMSHCHIAEHLHAGMMFGFRVENEDGTAPGDEYRASLPPGAGHAAMQAQDAPSAQSTTPVSGQSGLPYAYDDLSAVDREYSVNSQTKTVKAGVMRTVDLSFANQNGELVSLNSQVQRPLSVTFVSRDGVTRFETFPGNTSFPAPHMQDDGHDHVHALWGISVAYADGTHPGGHPVANEALYSVPVQFPATGMYRGFVQFTLEGETTPRIGVISLEVNEGVFSIDNFGWTDQTKWWVLFIASIIAMLPLVWVVRKYINIEKS